MKHFYSFFLALSFGLFINNGFAQEASDLPWFELMNQDGVNYYEVESKYNDYFSNKEKAKGSGYKHFERWARWAYQDMDEQGNLPLLIQKREGLNAVNQLKREMPLSASRDEEAVWTSLGPDSWVNTTGWNPGIGRVNEIVVHPENDQIIYIGTPMGGLWKTEDLGQNWIPLTDNLPSLGVSGIVIDYTNPETIYIATGDAYSTTSYSTGVYKSTDGGLTFEETGLTWATTDFVRLRKMSMHPTDPNVIIVASTDGLFKTSNGGETWAQVSNGGFWDVKFKPGNPEIVYTVTSTRFRKSTDGGDSFSNVTNGIATTGIGRLALAVTPAAEDNVYLLATETTFNGFGGFYKSTDGGESFTLTTSTPNILGYALNGSSEGGQGWYDLALAVSPTDPDWIITGGIHTWISTNGGQSFTNNSDWYYPTSNNYVHADIHYLGFWGDRLYCGNDGGINYTDNLGADWSDISEGLEINQLYRIDASPTVETMVLGGSQDNGCNVFLNDQWIHYLGADGMEVAVDPSNPNIFYGATQNGGIRRTTNGGTSFSSIKNNIDETGAWVTPYKIAPSSPNILYIGYTNLWKTTNRGNSWTKLSNFPTNNNVKVNEMAVYKQDENYVVFSRGAALFKTTDGGDNIVPIGGAGLPGSTVTYIEIHPQNPEIIYVSYGGWGEQPNRLFVSTDGGDSWENITQNLPLVPVRSFALQENSNGGIYVGTEFGIFYTDSALTSFVPYMDGLPNVRVTEFSINYNAGKIRAGTYGRGIWEAPLFTMPEIAPIPDFVSSLDVVCADNIITFSDISQYSTGDRLWEFEGGEPATSTEANPTVYYANSGMYQVKLTVTNDFGSSELIKEDFIRVMDDIGSGLPYSEGFEENELLEGLFLESNSDLWYISDAASFSGEQSLVFDNYNNNAYGNHEVITKNFDFTQNEDITLSFRYAFAGITGNPNNINRLRILASNNCGETWVLRGTVGGAALRNGEFTTEYYIPQNESEWKYTELSNFNANPNNPNTDFAQESIRLMFRFEPDITANNLWIDDININGEPITTFISEINANPFGVNLFPNPTDGVLNLNINAPSTGQMHVYLKDVTGRTVKSLLNNNMAEGEHNLQYDMSNLASGVYFISIDSDGITQTIKFIKR
jgi:PKD repeat protein/photosystem II stability/assembly factor-like uncharacterized protein